MKIKYEASFEKDLRGIHDKKLMEKIKAIIDAAKQASHPSFLTNTKKLKSYDGYYRIRIGEYRIGIEFVEDELIFTRILHRKDIYRYFP